MRHKCSWKYKGIKYANSQKLYDAVKPEVSFSSFLRKLNKGETIEQAMKKKCQEIKIKYKNITYSSITEFCEIHGIERTRFYHIRDEANDNIDLAIKLLKCKDLKKDKLSQKIESETEQRNQDKDYFNYESEDIQIDSFLYGKSLSFLKLEKIKKNIIVKINK